MVILLAAAVAYGYGDCSYYDGPGYYCSGGVNQLCSPGTYCPGDRYWYYCETGTAFRRIILFLRNFVDFDAGYYMPNNGASSCFACPWATSSGYTYCPGSTYSYAPSPSPPTMCDPGRVLYFCLILFTFL